VCSFLVNNYNSNGFRGFGKEEQLCLFCDVESPSPDSNTTAATSMSSSSSSSSAFTSPAEALALEGLDGVDICQPKDIANVLKAINLQADKLIAGDKLKADGSNQQYLVFRGISLTDLAKLDRVRPKYTRVTYHKDINLLIIKLMPTAKHEAAHVNFSRRIDYKIYGMGMSASDLEGTGATRFEGCRDNDDDLPTIVIESGYSEPLERLQSGAKW